MGRLDRLVQGLGAEVGELCALEVGPQLLDGVELGSTRRSTTSQRRWEVR